ncbi:MAG: cysteine--tRNA ligase [Candidatus Roizmanbacteria bacterium]
MQKIQIYNSFSNNKEQFIPLNSNKVKMYVCGVTPYDTSHLGHAFVFTFFDVVKRLLTYAGYDVTYVQNVTDIDDPLIERAEKLHTTSEALADKWTTYLLNDFNFLNIALPDHYVKASQELDTMIQIITSLIEKKYAYIMNGNVYFSTQTFPNYMKLSKLDHSESLRISVERGNDIKDPNKKNPLDFLLWKKSKDTEPKWSSPWSEGRPGWHIECTAMSTKYLGEQIDIHGGGADLLFPHHESEIAQAEAYSGKSPFVKTWMHCAMVYLNGEKMSKSLGNLIYVQDLAKLYSANAIRYYILTHHYRKEWEYNEMDMILSAKKIISIETDLKDCKEQTEIIDHKILDLCFDDFQIPDVLENMFTTNNLKQKKLLFTVLGFR